jgi:hypothetical protein
MSPQISAKSDDCEIARDRREAWAGKSAGTNDRALVEPLQYTNELAKRAEARVARCRQHLRPGAIKSRPSRRAINSGVRPHPRKIAGGLYPDRALQKLEDRARSLFCVGIGIEQLEIRRSRGLRQTSKAFCFSLGLSSSERFSEVRIASW